jgi:hypothetical protein
VINSPVLLELFTHAVAIFPLGLEYENGSFLFIIIVIIVLQDTPPYRTMRQHALFRTYRMQSRLLPRASEAVRHHLPSSSSFFRRNTYAFGFFCFCFWLLIIIIANISTIAASYDMLLSFGCPQIYTAIRLCSHSKPSSSANSLSDSWISVLFFR